MTQATLTSAPARMTAAKAGAIGGLVFAATLILQNVMRGAANVANDASAATIMRNYADHRSAHWARAVVFVVGAFALVTFVASLWTRLRDGASAVPMRVGVLGTTLIMALFSMTVALDVALTSYVHLGGASPDVVRGLFVLHDAVFTILLLGIAIALVGLVPASVAGGLIGSAWRPAAVLGACALALSALAAPAVTEGSGLFYVSAIGFAVWVVCLVRIAVALWREPAY
jgi:hypothetical protein